MEIKELGIHDIVTINNTKCIILAIEEGIIKCTPWEQYEGDDIPLSDENFGDKLKDAIRRNNYLDRLTVLDTSEEGINKRYKKSNSQDRYNGNIEGENLNIILGNGTD